MVNFIERLNFRKRNERESKFFDYTLLFVVIFLIGFGLLMIYSASSYEANLAFGDAGYYLKRQFIASVIGFIGMIAVTFVPYKFWEKIPLSVYYIVPCVLLLLLLVPGVGVSSHNATRWIKLVGGFNLQPAEVAKVAMIFFYAKLLKDRAYLTKSWKGLGVLFIMPIIVVLEIYGISDNLSSAVIVYGIVICMMFVVSYDWKKFAIVGGGLGAFIAIVIFAILKFASADSSSFRFRRIFAWVHPEDYADGIGFQTLQALYAVGSGGIFGKGLGESMQKLSYIPEAQNDMIYSIICEELGLVGGFAVMALFAIMLWRLLVIANNTTDLYGALLVVGVLAHFAIQVILNIAVVTNTVPNTGISLPFISYGGSSIAFLLLEVGVALSVAKGIKFNKD